MNDHELEELNSLDRDSNEGDVYDDFAGTMRRRDGVREAVDDADRSRL